MTAARILNPPDSKAAIILLHGLGASADDLHPLAAMLCGGNLRAILPQAPTRSVTINGGMQMPAWYDIAGGDLQSRQDEKGVQESARRIEDIIAEETARDDSQKIFLGGFSQGAAMSLYVGMRCATGLAGMVALSGYLLLEETLAAEAAEENMQTPIFMGHGTADEVVLPDWARACRARLQNDRRPLRYKEYPAAHHIVQEEMDDLNAWMEGLL